MTEQIRIIEDEENIARFLQLAEIRDGQMEYDLEIDAVTGAVLEFVTNGKMTNCEKTEPPRGSVSDCRQSQS